MSDSLSDREPLEELAEVFVERYRRGERPSVQEYAEQHPHIAAQIRQLFPRLVLMEQMASHGSGRMEVAPAIDDHKAPTRLGDFLILREVARGGMGIVYEAEQESLGRRVALKVLMGNALASEKRRERFQREARASARLHHTNIVPVYGVGQHENVCYYVMQFIKGQGLDKVVRELRAVRGQNSAGTARMLRTDPDSPTHEMAQQLLVGQMPFKSASSDGKFSDSEDRPSSTEIRFDKSSSGDSDGHYFRAVARIGVQVSEALAYAHAQGTYHRDIKPSNLLLDRYGTIWVTDFGLAKLAEEDDLTQEGDIVGTLRYMAPEQFASHCDARTDIYSLGLTLYELLTLRPAFDKPNLMVSTRSKLVPPNPRRINPDIPRDLETIVLKATALEANRRYQAAGELAEDLRLYLADRPIAARRASKVEQTWRWCRRNPLVAGLTSAVAVLLLLVAVISAVLAIRFQAEKGLALENARLARENSARVFELAFAGARSRSSGIKAGHRSDSLNAIQEAARQLPELSLKPGRNAALMRDLRDEAISALIAVDMQLDQEWSLERPPFDLTRASFDSRIGSYAVQDSGGRIMVRRMADNTFLQRLGTFDVRDELRVYIQFSPDDQRLAARGPIDGVLKVCIWDLSDGHLIFEGSAGGRSYHTSIDFSPDGQSLVFYSARKRIDVIDLATGAVTRTIPVRSVPYYIRFDPSGRRLAVSGSGGGGRRSEVLVMGMDEPHETRRLVHPDFVSDAAWSADGRWLATPCYDYRIRVWNVDTGKVHAVCSGHRNKPRHVAFHPSGLLMSTAWDSTSRLWDPHTGAERIRASDRGVRFSRDGQWLGSEKPASTGVRRWRIHSGDACRTLYGHESNALINSLAFSPDSSLLVSSTDSDGVRIWSVASGREVAHPVKEYSAGVGFVAGPDNQWNLLTSSRSGLRSWPIELRRTTASATWRFDTPNVLPPDEPRKLSIVGRTVIVASTGAHVTLHQDENVFKIGPLPSHDGVDPKFVAVSPDGRWAATSSKRAGGVAIWDLKSRSVVRELSVGPARVTFDPTGKQLAASAFQQYIFWEVGTWRELRRFEHESPGYGRVAFSPDMKLLATIAANRVILSDAASGGQLATLQSTNPETLSTAHPEGVASLAFSPDGRFLAVGAQGGKIRLWDLQGICDQLADLGLDWGTKPRAAETIGDRALRVEFADDAQAD